MLSAALIFAEVDFFRIHLNIEYISCTKKKTNIPSVRVRFLQHNENMFYGMVVKQLHCLLSQLSK